MAQVEFNLNLVDIEQYNVNEDTDPFNCGFSPRLFENATHRLAETVSNLHKETEKRIKMSLLEKVKAFIKK